MFPLPILTPAPDKKGARACRRRLARDLRLTRRHGLAAAPVLDDVLGRLRRDQLARLLAASASPPASAVSAGWPPGDTPAPRLLIACARARRPSVALWRTLTPRSPPAGR